METLNHNAKIAILRTLQEIMNADGVIHENEVEYMNKAMLSFELDESCKPDVENLDFPKAIEEIKNLDYDQKMLVAQMMGKMVVIDEDINYNEVIIYNDICHQCNIEEEFNIDDYPEYSLSGPFINPEDIMNLDTL
jgi:hypothetical protein